MSSADAISSRTGLGVGIGALMGFMLGVGPWGAALGAIVGAGIAHSTVKKQGKLTPARQLIYTRAMESIKNPNDLRTLAQSFEQEGLRSQAQMLRKRAALRELPPQTKDNRRAAFRKSMAADNPEAIEEVAARFEAEGAIDAGKTLREHAAAVRAAHSAGKSAKPMPIQALHIWADKLAKAVIHFGPESRQAQTAASNLIRAQGKQASPEMIKETVGVAVNAVGAPAQAAAAATLPAEASADAPAEAPADTPTTPETPDAKEEAAPAPAAPIEPTVVGPPAPPIEPPVSRDITASVTVAGGGSAAASLADVTAQGEAIEEAAAAEALEAANTNRMRVA